MVLVGFGFMMYRFFYGLAATTNLDQQRPWGLWIAMDVGSGIALAGGGFIACAIFHVFHRERYHMLARSALVCALLGYTFYVPGLLADLGKWWKLPITMLPQCWQGNSVLFEVGMCVMIYLNVQYAELTPIVCERLLGENWFKRWPRFYRLTQFTSRILTLIMPALLCMGVCLSTFHQSSLGNLMVIAPNKLHHLWWSPWSPLFFLLSAMMVGLPMVIFTILFASWSLDREPEMHTLEPLARKYVPVFLVLYIIAKVADMIWRGTYSYLSDGSLESYLWIAEMILVVGPLVLFFVPAVRRSPRWLATACLLVILGVVLNRLNVLVIAFHPPYEQKPYFPSLTEFMASMGLIAGLMLVYRIAVTYLPILEPRQRVKAVAA
jgi:Ni/Fe-hydrogenase subunit HybB-like protein